MNAAATNAATTNAATTNDVGTVNRIQGKSVHDRAFAHERLQSPVSYAGINMFSRTILKTMYRTISNSTFDDESR